MHDAAQCTCQRLLANKPLGLAIELLDELPREQARLQDGDPPPHAILH